MLIVFDAVAADLPGILAFQNGLLGSLESGSAPDFLGAMLADIAQRRRLASRETAWFYAPILFDVHGLERLHAR